MVPCRACRGLLGSVLVTACAFLGWRRALPLPLPARSSSPWLAQTQPAAAATASGLPATLATDVLRPPKAAHPRDEAKTYEADNDPIARIRQRLMQHSRPAEEVRRDEGAPNDNKRPPSSLRRPREDGGRHPDAHMDGQVATSTPDATAALTMENTLVADGGEDPALQPKVITIESHPATKAFASISVPRGSVWCGGNRTYWMTGHQRDNETPWCEAAPGTWERSTTTALDVEDEANDDGNIDRHNCALMDVNGDGLPDVICGVGALRGTGVGYNELYLTRPDGKLFKIQSGHGLQKYPTMRNRYSVTLSTGVGNVKDLIFMATEGMKRADGRTNLPRMFRNIYESEDQLPYFAEVPGPWTRKIYRTECNVAGDFNNDGADDLIVCDSVGPPLLAIQVRNETRFRRVPLPRLAHLSGWRNARLADITLDGFLDLIVTTFGMPSAMYIFRGMEAEPYFDFRHPLYRRTFEYSTPDIEVLDVNNDGIADIYAIQTNITKENYCGPNDANAWWGGDTQPPAEWVPPLDGAPDVLLVGTGRATSSLPSGRMLFDAVPMDFAEPGCGNVAARFDAQTLLLSQGTWRAAGHQLLLEWQLPA